MQDIIDLTVDQKKAWNSLVRAVRLCKEKKVLFYQVLDELGAINGHNIKAIRCSDDRRLRDVPEQVFYNSRCLNSLHYPTVRISASFADDNHYVQLKVDE